MAKPSSFLMYLLRTLSAAGISAARNGVSSFFGDKSSVSPEQTTTGPVLSLPLAQLGQAVAETKDWAEDSAKMVESSSASSKDISTNCSV